jgi:prepilin-type processing-associated H-X9-DG protein
MFLDCHIVTLSLDCPFLIGPSVFSNAFLLFNDKQLNRSQVSKLRNIFSNYFFWDGHCAHTWKTLALTAS